VPCVRALPQCPTNIIVAEIGTMWRAMDKEAKDKWADTGQLQHGKTKRARLDKYEPT